MRFSPADVSHALAMGDVVAINPQLFITATFVALVVVLALGVALLVLLESRDARNRQDR